MNKRDFLKTIASSLTILGFIPKSVWSGILIIKEKKMKMTLHKAETRGEANHGWLASHHSFSFANYYNPKRMGFGALRVINDDIIEPSAGFGTHPHRDMEIISIPISGALKHKDTMGNEHVIKKGEIQAMSAGRGIAHSEYNNSSKDKANFLQIWIMPKHKGIEPSYSQKDFLQSERLNKAQLIVSPNGRDDSVQINQDAYFSLLELESGKSYDYSNYINDNGVYIFILNGKLDVDGQVLEEKDGLGIEGSSSVRFSAKSHCEVLIMEVPLKF